MENYLEINYENNMKMLAQALKYCEQNFLHEDLINELSSDDDIKKQLCIIELKKINSQQEANLLVDNLTGKSGPVREAASFKILELISDASYKVFFQTREITDAFTKGITDINPAVSRNTVEIIKYVDDSNYLINNIIRELNNTLSKMDDIKQNRSYKTNKKNFNLYWNLEALINLSEKLILNDDIIKIINITYESNDYTIREKTAKLISVLDNEMVFRNIIDILKNDDNIYVSKYFI